MESGNDPLPSGSADVAPAAVEPSPPAPAQPHNEPQTTSAEATEATSEANIAAADPNASDLPVTTTTEEKPVTDAMDVDVKAADIAEGENSGAAIVAPGTSEDVESAITPKRGGNQKRRASGVPEHKQKKALGKKKSMPVLNLDAEPGDYYFARLKGHPPWPSIVCDEEMLPEALLASRPVTAKRPDGSYREDFMPEGKNAKDRTYPVMFLETNEFAWVPNVDLTKIDFDSLSNEAKGKKSKALWEAHELAKHQHDLSFFKKMLQDFEEERQHLEEEFAKQEAEKQAAKQAQAEQKEAKKAERAAKKEAKESKSAKRKSKGGDTDVDMEDADADDTTVKSSAKKRKKAQAGGEADDSKPAKTPKTSKSLKVNLSKSNGESAKAKPKATKSKSSPKEEQPALSEAEYQEKKEKSVLWLRHKLQKGFLQETPPAESEMKDMSDHFNNLQAYSNLESSIIRNTKIHKVLKAIIRLDSIPLDDEFHFRSKATALLQGWNKILADEAGTMVAPAKSTKATNGASPDAKPESEKAEDAKTDAPKSEEPKAEEPNADGAKSEEKPTEDAKEETNAVDPKTEVAQTDEPKAGAAEPKTSGEPPAPIEPPNAPVEGALPGNDAKDELDNTKATLGSGIDCNTVASPTETKEHDIVINRNDETPTAATTGLPTSVVVSEDTTTT